MITDEENIASLIAFEQEIADTFNRGEIRFPIHLSGGNEKQLLTVFEDFNKGDWCFSSWRSHYHALLAGIPPEEIKRQIMAGRSMTICSPEHRFFASAIVAGCCPIALGVAWQIKRNGGKEKVFCFLGDMASLTGIALECQNYAKFNELPIVWVIEDNQKSVCTVSHEAWGAKNHEIMMSVHYNKYLWKYDYDLSVKWPHAGSGSRINF